MSKAKEITIAGRKIGAEFPPYIIAEMSANHNGDIQKLHCRHYHHKL